jgi:tryptophan-rich sensory protein
MKRTILQLAAICSLAFTLNSSATVLYVDLNSTNPLPPYAGWSTAATNIQDAIDAANPGDQILVTNGVYQTGGRVVYGSLTNRVAVTRAVTVQSVSGPSLTVIQGNPIIGDSAVRCVYLTNNAALLGFTLTNGATRDLGDSDLEQSGAGVWCEDSSAAISNCVITRNSASDDGGGAFCGTFANCNFTGNTAGYNGGAATQSTLTNCILSGNFANFGGGAYESTLYNSVLTANVAAVNGGGVQECLLNNCTLTGNSCGNTGGGSSASSLNNCIVYYNSAPSEPNYTLYSEVPAVMNNCCTTPLPPSGTGNITAEPILADFAHLGAGSPCRGAGDAAYSTGVDIDGEPWLNPPSIGCDEYYPGAITGPLTVAIYSDYTNVAPGFSLNFIGQIAGHADSNVWDFGDGATATNRVYASHDWPVAGDYLVTFTAFNDSNPGGVSATVLVRVTEEIHYVDLASATPILPFTSWSTAATNIQDAVDAVVLPGAKVVVTDGVYVNGGRAVGAQTNRVVIARFVQVQSVNGPAMTVIQGYQDPDTIIGDDAVRCVYLADGARLTGFSLTYGGTRANNDWSIPDYEKNGGGVWCEPGDAVVSNCVFIASAAVNNGGGISGGTVFNSVLTNNTAGNGGGADSCTLNNCLLVGNSTGGEGGGAISCTLNNCGLTANSANQGGGIGDCTANHCTFTANSAGEGGGAYNATLNNSIAYYNTASNGSNYSGGVFNFSCTVPLPDNGTNNITAEPLLADPLHLSAGSPCLGAGSTDDTTGTDLDGEPWAVPPAMGCDEFYPGSITGPLSVAIQGTTYVPTGYVGNFTATINGHASANFWDFGDGTVVSNHPYLSHSWAVAGDYAVVFRAFNDSNPGGVSATTTVHVATQLVYYVNAACTNPVAPYFSWTTAATNIQSAVDAAWRSGSLVLVTNGVYGPSIIDQPQIVQSVNGPAVTIIDGASADRCVYIVDGAALVGFTLTHGASDNGGGVFATSPAAVLTNCILTANSATGLGGGAFSGTLNNCILQGNSATGYHGGGASYSTLNNCTLSGNSATYDGGGAFWSTLNNCVLNRNTADIGGGLLWGTANNCTLIDNHADSFGGGTFALTLQNCIVYYNDSPSGPNDYGSTFSYCCTTPNPGSGTANLTNAPLFVDQANSNFRLQSNSPCINAGNNAYVVGTTDLDGRPRIQNGAVDIGAYEFQPGVSGLFIGWLQQYGLPTDGSADYLDSDGDGMNNWQEWIAGTDPTNPLSVLKMTSAISTNNPSGLLVTWQSVSGKNYFLQRAADLTTQPAFSTIQSNIAGQANTTSYTDTTATNSGPYFYRVGVQ